MTELTAYIDESRKPIRDSAGRRPTGDGHHYVVAAAIVFAAEIDSVAARVASAEAGLGLSIHYADLRSRALKQAGLKAINGIEEWDAYIFETRQSLPSRNFSEHHVRAKILDRAFTYLGSNLGVTNVVLETRDTPHRGLTQLDEKDHRVLQKLLTRGQVPSEMRIEHAGKRDRLLAIPDVIAGARSDLLCHRDREAYPLIAHRVRDVVVGYSIAP